MTTVADLTVKNSSGSSITCGVSECTCMLENGSGGSHLERFNTTIAAPGTISAPVASDGSGECDKIQSQFTLAFSSETGYPNGSVTLEVGRGKFKTGIVSVWPPDTFRVSYSHHHKHRNLYVEVLPAPAAMVNSLIWANIPPLAASLVLPAFKLHLGGLTAEFDVSTLSGLENLHCTHAELSGTAETLVMGELKLEASELYTHGGVKLKYKGIHVKTGAGLTLKSPRISAAAVVQSTPECPFRARLVGLRLDSADVEVRAAGVYIPDIVLSLLMQIVMAAVSNGPANALILKVINSRLPGHKCKDEEEAP